VREFECILCPISLTTTVYIYIYDDGKIGRRQVAKQKKKCNKNMRQKPTNSKINKIKPHSMSININKSDEKIIFN